jgi:hypothetical protein
MSTRQLTLSDFAAHCVEEIRSLQEENTVIEILSSGKVVALLSPPPAPAMEGTLADWMGGGAGLMSFGPNYDPEAPAFADDDWESMPEEEK